MDSRKGGAAMKRMLTLLLALAMLAALCACGEETVAGFTAASVPGVLVLAGSDGERTAFHLTEDTAFFLPPELTQEDMLAGRCPDADISVTRGRRDGSFTNAIQDWTCKAYDAKTVNVRLVDTGTATILSDGTELEIWRGRSETVYMLPGHQELLTESGPTGPRDVIVAGVDSALSDAAWEDITAYYDMQGLLYDETAQLESAYAAWQADPNGYRSRTLSQDIYPSMSNEHIICFTTTVTYPLEDGTYTADQSCAVFDRTTGQPIPTEALFTCSADELADVFLTEANVGDEALLAEMRAAFRPEYIFPQPEHLTLYFPTGSLPSQKHSYIIGLDYAGHEGLKDLLQDWALPDGVS